MPYDAIVREQRVDEQTKPASLLIREAGLILCYCIFFLCFTISPSTTKVIDSAMLLE